MSPLSPSGIKRAHEETEQSPVSPIAPAPLTSATATSAFRNVSACNRCRVRKNRCDQQLPACSACTKANVRCVGYDPITKREIPRSYVYFLETRLKYFEKLLKEHDVPFDAAETFDADSGPLKSDEKHEVEIDKNQRQEDDKLDNLVSNIGMVSVHGASNNRYLGSTSGISFARVVLSAVKKSASSDKDSTKSLKAAAAGSARGTTMRETYFGLQTKSTIKEAPFPDRELGLKLVNLYFEHANPQIPILHRDEFHEVFERAYETQVGSRTPKDLYFLNIVFAMGSGIIWGSSDPEPSDENTAKRARLSNQQAQPEEYHASAIVHLGPFLSANADGEGGGDLQELQAVLLLAGFALLRPIAPGLWYIVGVAMRLAIDLGLHYEDGSGLKDADLRMKSGRATTKRSPQYGKRQYMRDLRRRLWWCTYTFDRLVSTCVGRPFGITDQVITTEFPSLLDDKYITTDGLAEVSAAKPSYKRVAHHYFRLRLLQSEIVQVLQYEQAQIARMKGWNRDNHFMHKTLPSPFLIRHKSFKSWRKDIDQRLFDWKETAPSRHETGVSFSPQFLELNYWQAVTMLYRQSLSVPPAFAGEMSPTDDVTSPSSIMTEDKEDEDLVFLKCAEAGQRTLKIYRQLHRQRLVNYTYLATHHLFMAGISFLYAVWHSPAVRSRISLDDFDFTVLAATSVLSDLTVKCPPAEACREAFERMSKATVQMCMSSSGFGFGSRESPRLSESTPTPIAPMPTQLRMQPPTKRPMPRFDMNLQDLFPESSSSSQPRARPDTGTGTARQARMQTSPTVIRQMDVPMQDDPKMYEEQQYFPETNHAMQNSYNPDFMSNLGMDILNNFTGAQIQPFQHVEERQEEWLDVGPASTEADESEWGLGSGFGVGVGMGLDFGPQHDWSDGQNGFNLFDGFFFGGEDGPGPSS